MRRSKRHSVFAVLTIEIKPQMEKVLNLQAGALTKEIALTQGLSDLFIEYQISPDLLSFEGDDKAGMSQRLKEVRDVRARSARIPFYHSLENHSSTRISFMREYMNDLTHLK